VKGAGGDVAPVLVVSSRAASHTAIDKLRAAGAEVLVVTGQNEASRVGPALRELGSRGVQSLLLEGGPRLAGAFLDAGEVDEARVFVAPKLTGGKEARTAVEGEGAETIAEATEALSTAVEVIDDDVLITARLKEW
jgi:diaminohydroxyphosphoribosylaminopyrimidine deaminase/5-amino-6-(5-phosphoribosylamino)uracil reductase